jgi:hypothetical protein
MAGAGFVLDGSLQGPDHSGDAAFALAERLTGVGVTESLLATAELSGGTCRRCTDRHRRSTTARV